MSKESDRGIMGDVFQTTLAMSLGAAYRGCEMLLHPSDALSTLASETKAMFTVAGVWTQKGAARVIDFKTVGEKFLEGK
jgi:hypothetical protein